jgi:hypothetical protein
VSRRVVWPLVVLGGLGGGLVWGIHARVWMRFISTDPQFTWSGTLFIVLGFGIAGLAQSAAHLGRRAGLRRSRLTALRVVTFAGLLPLGAAAGGPLFPTIVIAPLALTHTEWSTRTRLVLVGVAIIPIVAIGGILLDDLSVARAARRVRVVPGRVRRHRVGSPLHDGAPTRRLERAPVGSSPRRSRPGGGGSPGVRVPRRTEGLIAVGRALRLNLRMQSPDVLSRPLVRESSR